MMEMDWSALLLEWVISYGSMAVGAMLLLGAMGVPLPSTLVVIATGAFIRQEMLSMMNAPIVGIVGVLIGDTIVFGIGRFANHWIEKYFGKTAAWQSAQQSFEKRGGIAIYLTRWLVTPLAIPTNLIAGSSGYAFPKFFLFDAAGELTWILLFGGLGYAFGSQWELISELITNFSGLIVSVLALLAGLYLLVRFWHRTDRAKHQEASDLSSPKQAMGIANK